MLRKLKSYLNERWEKIKYMHIEIFYMVLGIVTLISFIIAIFNKTMCIWNIVAVMSMIIWLIMCYLYYVFYDKVDEKKKKKSK